jgi:hypothetical protein
MVFSITKNGHTALLAVIIIIIISKFKLKRVGIYNQKYFHLCRHTAKIMSFALICRDLTKEYRIIGRGHTAGRVKPP